MNYCNRIFERVLTGLESATSLVRERGHVLDLNDHSIDAGIRGTTRIVVSASAELLHDVIKTDGGANDYDPSFAHGGPS